MNSAGGFKWKYQHDISNNVEMKVSKSLKPLNQIHPETKEIVKSWKSIKEAAR